MNIISSGSMITTIEQVEPFVSIVPPLYGRDSGKAWLIECIVTTQAVTPNDGFAHAIFHGEEHVNAYARRLTQRGTPTGASHLVWWLHDREAMEREWLASPQARAQGVS
jgi:hypothetical protein